MSVDVQGLHLIPLNPALRALNPATGVVVPVKDIYAAPADHHHKSVVLIHPHTQAHQAAKKVVRVRVAPVKFHAADVTAPWGQGDGA